MVLIIPEFKILLMEIPHTMKTLSEVLNKLKAEGYTTDFNLNENCLVCNGNSLQIRPGEFVVDRHYRFEGPTDPGDEAIVYAISSVKDNIKGVLVNGYGIYSNDMTDEMVKALSGVIPSSANEEKASEEKSNQSTPQRPEGDRILDAPLVHLDLHSFKQQIKSEEGWSNNDRNSITIFKTEEMRIVMIALHQDAEMKKHTAPGVISVQVLEGQITFRTEQQSEILNPGQMVTLHAGIPHHVFANQESVFLLTLTNNSSS